MLMRPTGSMSNTFWICGRSYVRVSYWLAMTTFTAGQIVRDYAPIAARIATKIPATVRMRSLIPAGPICKD